MLGPLARGEVERLIVRTLLFKRVRVQQSLRGNITAMGTEPVLNESRSWLLRRGNGLRLISPLAYRGRFRRRLQPNLNVTPKLRIATWNFRWGALGCKMENVEPK
jgi:hypothetical protein